jgi:SAM-dependent methyltransferase
LAIEVGRAGSVTAVDLSVDMNAIASRRAREAGLGDRIEVVRGDALALAFPDAYSDAAASTQVLEYVDDVGLALRELRRVAGFVPNMPLPTLRTPPKQASALDAGGYRTRLHEAIPRSRAFRRDCGTLAQPAEHRSSSLEVSCGSPGELNCSWLEVGLATEPCVSLRGSCGVAA